MLRSPVNISPTKKLVFLQSALQHHLHHGHHHNLSAKNFMYQVHILCQKSKLTGKLQRGQLLVGANKHFVARKISAKRPLDLIAVGFKKWTMASGPASK